MHGTDGEDNCYLPLHWSISLIGKWRCIFACSVCWSSEGGRRCLILDIVACIGAKVAYKLVMFVEVDADIPFKYCYVYYTPHAGRYGA
jgi:hypothetical protein